MWNSWREENISSWEILERKIMSFLFPEYEGIKQEKLPLVHVAPRNRQAVYGKGHELQDWSGLSLKPSSTISYVKTAQVD